MGQSLDVQFEKLKGCDKVFREKRSGVDVGRPALKQCLEFLREGDTLVCTENLNPDVVVMQSAKDRV